MEEKENAAMRGVSIEVAIAVLESLRDRIKTYEHMYSQYPKDYIEDLAEVDKCGLDKAISVLKGQVQ
jgi:hypothetical protein